MAWRKSPAAFISITSILFFFVSAFTIFELATVGCELQHPKLNLMHELMIFYEGLIYSAMLAIFHHFSPLKSESWKLFVIVIEI